MLPVFSLTLASGTLAVGTAAVKKFRRRQRTKTFLNDRDAVVDEHSNRSVDHARQAANNGVVRMPARLHDSSDAKLKSLYGRPYPAMIDTRNLIAIAEEIVADIITYIRMFDNKYQQFMQARIDPLFGRTRLQHLQTLASEGILEISKEEKAINRHIAFGVVAVGAMLIGQWVFPPLFVLAVAARFLFTLKIYQMAYKAAVEDRRLRMIHLIAFYVAGMWFWGYFFIAVVGTLLFFLSNKLAMITEDRSRKSLINVFKYEPRSVWVLVDGTEIELPFAELRAGDTIVLDAGQTIPVDGSVLDGVASVDQHMLTGESQLVEKTIGDEVLASTVVLAGRIYVRVDKAGADTTAAQIGEILNRTSTYKLDMLSKSVEMMDRSLYPTLTASLVSLPLIGSRGAITMLGSNFFGMLAAGPISMLNFLNIAARKGILLKDGRSLERLDKIDTIVFDKTGTLTLEQPHVAHIYTYNGMADDEVLALAAAAEYRQTHPIARAIQAAAEEQQLTLPTIEQAQYEVGYGIKVRLSERLIRIGSQRFMTMEGVDLPMASQEHQAFCHGQGHSLVIVSVGDELAGSIELQPTIRPEAKHIVDGLQARGLSLYIISGDHEAPTQKLATELDIPGYFANTLPEHKADLVKQLQEEGRCVCFIGDGINDAIAMRQADVSISLRGATTAATDTAQIVLMDASLNQLLELLILADEFNRNIELLFRSYIALSLLCAGGILFLHFDFIATELFYSFGLAAALGIVMKPVLQHQKDEQLMLTEA